MDIQILEIKSPGSFLAREIPGPSMSAEMQEYQRMDQEIQNYCESSHYVDIHVLAPQKGQMYLAKRREEHESHWYRCIVKTVLRTSGGAKASCYLIDRAQTILVSHTHMREVPDKFRDMPCRVQEFSLSGIQPITMSISFIEGAEMKPTVKWDTAACEYFERLIKGKALQCQVVGTNEEGVKETLLFVKHQGDLLNVNNILVKKQFACHFDGTGTSPGSMRSFRTPSPSLQEESIAGDPFHDVSLDQAVERRPSLTEGSPKITSPTFSTHSKSPLSPPRPRAPFMLPQVRTPSPSAAARSRTPSPSHGAVGFKSPAIANSSPPPDHSLSMSSHSKSPLSPPHPPKLFMLPQLRTPSPDVSTKNPTSSNLGGRLTPPVMDTSPKTATSPGSLLQNMQMRLRTPPRTTGEESVSGTRLEGKHVLQSLMTSGINNAGSTGTRGGESTRNTREERERNSQEDITSRTNEKGDTGDVLHGDIKGLKLGAVGGALAKSSHSTQLEDSPESTACAPTKPALSPLERMRQMQESLKQRSGTGTISGQGESLFSSMGMMRIRGPSLSPGREAQNGVAQSDGSVSDSSLGNVQQSPGNLPSGSEEGYSSQDDAGVRQNLSQTALSPDSKRTPFLLSSTKIQASLSKQLLSLHEKSVSTATVPSPLLRKILIHGERPPKLILDIKTSPFPDKLKQYLREFGYPGLTLIQSACWAAISRGRDVVGVAPRDQNVSLAYLAPLVAQMMQSSYTELPAGHGPITLIVSSGWQRALSIYQQCLCLNGNNTNSRLKAILLHRAGSEEEQKVQLVNGAPIIIGTLPCVLRLAGSCHVNLNRLFHLVIDDADNLFDHHLEAVKDLMVRFRTVLRVNKKRSTLRQLMVFSSKWTVAMGSYLRTYLTDPLVIIADPLEMAVYGRVPQKLILIHPSKRVTILLEKLNSGLDEAGKVMVFTATKETARDLVKILKCSSCFTLLAAGEMLAHQLEDVRYEWQTGHRSDSQPVLVVSDDCVEDLELQDASCIIHYDLPSSKVKYGKRMACLKEKYSSQIEKSNVSPCQAMTLVTPENNHHLYSLLYIIKRSGQQLPEEITLNKALEFRDKRRTSRPLCHNIKSFGFCRQVSSCAGRHFINPSEDQPGINPHYMTLPQQGQVKILVMHVVDAITFYARIMKYQPSIEEGTIPITQLKGNPQLNIQLSRWFSDQERCVPATQTVIGKLYATQDNKKSIHRVLAEKWVKGQEYEEERRIQVKFVDEGRTEVLPSYKLLALPKTFRNIPYQAVQVITCGAMPPDKESAWTTQANLKIHNLIHGEELEGKVVLSLGNTMWLDPVVQRIRVPDLKNLINRCNVRLDIIEGDYGIANPSHVSRIQELCFGKVTLEQDGNLNKKQETSVFNPHYESLTVGETFQVYLSAVGSPHQFSVQKVDIVDRLDKLMTEINREDVAVENRLEGSPDWSVGDLCLAKFPLDDRWYRGKITELGGDMEVVFIDHGDQETVPSEDLKPLPNKLLKLPFAAIDCTMPHITPREGGEIWSSEAGDEMWSWCNEGAIKNVITLKVLSEEDNADIGGGDKRYSVEMFLFLEGKKVAVSYMLAKTGLVNIDREQLAQILMPFSHLEENDDATTLMRAVCQQCHKILGSQDVENTTRLSQELYQQILEIRNLPESSDAASSIQDAIVAVCRLLNHHEVLSDKSRVLITDGLLQLVNTDWGNAKVVVEEGCIPSLCMTLRQIVDPDIHHRIFWLFNIFPTKKLLTNDNFPRLLFDVFITVPSPDIQICCLQLLIKLWQREDIKALLPLQELITAICNILWGYPGEALICESVKMLQLLTTEEEAVAMMQKEKLGNCLECLSLSKCLSVDGEAYRLIMDMSNIFDAESDFNSMGSADEGCEVIGVIPFVNRREHDDSDEGTSVDGPLIPTRSLEGAASSERETTTNSPDDGCFMINPTPPPLLDDDDRQIVHPQVRWSQRSNSIMISVQLRGVQSYILEVTSLSIRFSTLYDDQPYEFDIELCNRVDPDNYTSRATGHEVLITLYKEGVGVSWPRLTSTKIKMPFLSVDYERWKEEDDYGYDSEATSVLENQPRVVREEDVTAATIPELVESTDSSSSSDSEDNVSTSSWSDAESHELAIGKEVPRETVSEEDTTD